MNWVNLVIAVIGVVASAAAHQRVTTSNAAQDSIAKDLETALHEIALLQEPKP